MTTANVHQDATAASEAEDVADIDAATPAAADEAKDILAKARYEAFRLMTDARQEAEEILDQARTEASAIRTEAEMQAESIIDAAHMRAEEIQEEGSPSDTNSSMSQLEQEHEELTERVSSLRSLADQLEERFAALAETSAPRPSIEEPPRPVLDYSPSVPGSEGPATAASLDRTADAGTADPSTGPVLDYSPSVPHPEPVIEADVGDEDPKPVEEERGSFYSRRSAKLPRIGEAGGQSALDMMRSIRESFEDD